MKRIWLFVGVFVVFLAICVRINIVESLGGHGGGHSGGGGGGHNGGGGGGGHSGGGGRGGYYGGGGYYGSPLFIDNYVYTRPYYINPVYIPSYHLFGLDFLTVLFFALLFVFLVLLLK